VGEVIASLPAPSGEGTQEPVPGGRGERFHHRITERWREGVREDAARRGVLPAGEETGKEILTRYGSTLLVAVVDGSEAWVGRIGDGDVLLVRPDGSIEVPLGRDEELLGTVTYSLSSREAPALWRTARFPAGPGGLLLLATDGLSDSFEDPVAGIQVFARSLADRVASFGIERIGAALPGWLDGYSREGSGDDMTLAFALLNPSQEAGTGEEGPAGEGAADARYAGTEPVQPEGGEGDAS
jgi:serine/threonine protein phosphatase PrpC